MKGQRTLHKPLNILEGRNLNSACMQILSVYLPPTFHSSMTFKFYTNTLVIDEMNLIHKSRGTKVQIFRKFRWYTKQITAIYLVTFCFMKTILYQWYTKGENDAKRRVKYIKSTICLARQCTYSCRWWENPAVQWSTCNVLQCFIFRQSFYVDHRVKLI